MANNLTGDFDVVAEFSLPAVNRILAAMHQCERFLHSISVRVDDNPHPSRPGWPTAVGVVDAFGEAIADQQRIGSPNPFPGPGAAADANFSRVGALLNPDLLGAVIAPPPPSHIQGIAQLQLFPPTVETSGANLSVRMNVIARFFPDKDTAPLAQFMRGDLVITAPVTKVATGRVHVLDVNFKAEDATISFTPTYASETLSPEDLAGISLCIQNGLRTSFLPSSVMLPSSIADVQLKTLPNAIAVLLDMFSHTPASTIASVNNVFLSAEDDFGFCIGRDFIISLFRNTVSSFTQFQPFNVHVTIWGTTTYTISLTSPPSLDLQPGAIVLTIQAHAHSSKDRFPSFNFTTRVSFTLNLIATGEGGLNAAELAFLGVSVDFTDSGLGGWIKDQIVGAFSGRITDQISAQVNAILNSPNPQPGDLQSNIRQMTDADANLGNYLSAQMTPSDGTPPPSIQRVFLIYTSVEIQPAGVILHGSVLLFDWPAPNVEFEQIPASVKVTNPANVFGQGPDYSALKSWIPGGTIDQYEWRYFGQTNPFHVDANRFVLLASGPSTTEVMAMASTAVTGYSPLCLTVRGTRLSNFGPVVPEPVSATSCGFTRFPVVLAGAVALQKRGAPMITLTQAGADGHVSVSGHLSAQTSQRGSGVPNLLVHFADAKTSGQLDVLIQALGRIKKTDAPAAVIAVVPGDELQKIRYTPGLIYAEDVDAWQTILGLKSAKRPLTVIVNPRGIVVWQKEGSPDLTELEAALNKNLVSGNSVHITVPRLNARVGQPALNFLYEIAPGREMPLSKLRGQPVTLVFWKGASRVSIDVVRRLHATKDSSPVVLAINDGDSADLARRVAAENGFVDALVMDGKREISSGYGVEIWPTIVSLDASGMITAIAYGDHGGEHPPTNSKKKTASR
ncbi:MAG TPA: TlpA disulfide reductase family protein [Terriglobales bacterium]|nr:TlpA disulfide reductase family protein [Terriglobales bacterium]